MSTQSSPSELIVLLFPLYSQNVLSCRAQEIKEFKAGTALSGHLHLKPQTYIRQKQNFGLNFVFALRDKLSGISRE